MGIDTDTPTTRWCNGNTRDFGSLVQGSSPCRVALFFRRVFCLTGFGKVKSGIADHGAGRSD